MEEMEHLADICLKHNIYVLSDEAYFDILYDGTPKSITDSRGFPRVTVILYTFSKKFAMTGWRLGAAIGPREVIEAISRFNVNDESCTNNFVQWAGVAALRGPLDDHRKMIDILRERRDTALSILNNTKGIHVATPDSTFYLFPNVTKAMEKLGMEEVEDFRSSSWKKLASRSPPGTTSAHPCRARPRSTFDWPTRGSTPPRSSKDSGR
jgi:aspartate/methionine/tyrosine aminotransferase